MKNGLLMEFNNLKVGVAPVDVNAAAQTGARISMKDCEQIAILVSVGAGTGDVKVTLQQHNAASAGTSKDLLVTNPVFIKASGATKFTEVTPVGDSATQELTDLDAVTGIAVVEVLVSDLDVNGGFSFISANVPATAAAKVVGVLYQTRINSYCPPYEQDI